MNLSDIVDALRSLADAISGTAPETAPVAHVPDGEVAVNPTGVEGAGKVRYWPAVATGELIWGYATRCMNTVNPVTGKPFWPAGRWGILAQTGRTDSYPIILDRLTYPKDWMMQAELDTAAALAERDAGHGFSPGG